MPHPGTLFLGIIFGIVGIIAWRKGRAEGEIRPMAAGVALILFGYFVPNPWLALLVGLALSAVAFWR